MIDRCINLLITPCSRQIRELKARDEKLMKSADSVNSLQQELVLQGGLAQNLQQVGVGEGDGMGGEGRGRERQYGGREQVHLAAMFE